MSVEKAKSYIQGVASGQIPACKWVKLAIGRHLSDLKKQNTPGFPYYFDADEADYVLGIYKYLRFTTGNVEGKPFDLMPWFATIVYMAFGWRRPGGGKRFRKVYCKVARGNAKTENLVSVGVIGFLFEGSRTPEVVWAATKKDQARIGWERQREMLKMLCKDEPSLAKELDIPKGRTATKVSHKERLASVYYLGRDSDKEDGLKPSMAIIDEYHAWDNDDILNVLESGMVKVDDPQTWIITTAGYKPQGPNTAFLKSCKRILEGRAKSDELLAFVYELDETDDWRDQSVWYKSNPGLGESLSIEALRTEYEKIQASGLRKEIDFKVKNLNMEAQSEKGWIPVDIWNKGDAPVTLEDFTGRICYGGLDLANTNDFNAFVLFSPSQAAEQKSLCMVWYWMPEDAVEKHRTKRPFIDEWAQQGYITVTPGNVTDYELIRRDIVAICKGVTTLSAIAFDRALSFYLTPALIEDGFRMEVFQQSWTWLTPAAKQLETMAQKGELSHGGNPVLAWNMANVVLQFDRNENYLPTKGKSTDKIDGVAALLNAIGQWLKERDVAPPPSSYLLQDDRDLVEFDLY